MADLHLFPLGQSSQSCLDLTRKLLLRGGGLSFDLEQMASVATAWQSSVVDFSKRNNLLFYKPTTQTLSFTESPASVTDSLLDGTAVSLSIAFGGEEIEVANKVAAKLKAKQDYLLEELGVSPIFLAIGFCSWVESEATGSNDDEKTTYAPVYLLQVELSNKRSNQDGWTIKPASELRLNGVLAHAASAAGFSFDEDTVNASLPESLTLEGLQGSLSQIGEALSGLQSFKTVWDLQLAAFGYQDEAIYRDLSDVDALFDSEVIRALAGDVDAISKLQIDPSVDAAEPDYSDPSLENLVLDADSSQIQAITTAVKGATVVVEGPPGTGKSQTIANLLVEAVANGQKVLFVAQKRAAITAVLSRLANKELDSVFFDLHNNGSNSSKVANQVAGAYENLRNALPVLLEPIQKELKESRDGLVALKDAFTKEIRGIGLTLSKLQDLHYETPIELRPAWRLPAGKLKELSADEFIVVVKGIRQAAQGEAFKRDFRTRADSWNVDKVRSPEDIADAANLARNLLDNHLPYLLEKLQGEHLQNSTVGEMRTVLSVRAAFGWLEANAPKVLRKPLSSDELQVAKSIYLQEIKPLSWVDKALVRAKLGFSVGGDNAKKSEAIRFLMLLEHLDTVTPASTMTQGNDHERLWNSLQLLSQVLSLLQGQDELSLRLADFEAGLRHLITDNSQFRIANYWDALATLEKFGLQDAIRHLHAAGEGKELTPSDVEYIFKSAAASSLIEDALFSDLRLRGMSSANLDALTKEFQRSDKSHLAQNSLKVSRLAAEAFNTARLKHPAEDAFLQNESAKRRAHKSLREMLRRAPNLLLAAKPVWVMSPIEVARLLPRKKMFDLVVFDEASQIRPEMAVPALIRAKHAVVAGDSNQLPPTNFFSGGGLSFVNEADSGAEAENDSSDDNLRDSESILEAMERIVGTRKKRLLWHYRSRDERLIALSNIEIYGNSLTTFPASDTPDALRHVLVSTTRHKEVATGSQNNEADEVISLIREHISNRPTESLGVITFGIKHLEKLEMALAQARKEDAQLDSFLDQDSPEPFFMKNLERVQGDERDAIIISTGYGKDANGRMNLQWGPLTSENGRRRLNVAISRAKKRMILVTNFTLADLSGLTIRPGTGVDLFKKFLDFVTNDGSSYSGTPSLIPLNGFELDIKRRLEAEGLQLETQFGVSNYRIDFAVRDERDPSKFALAVEADGASYHSGHIARERDRLRQSLLESRGWKFHRIWSTDWFSNPDREVAKVVARYQAIITDGSMADSPSTALESSRQLHHAKPFRRLPAPSHMGGRDITDYSDSELEYIVKYAKSDSVLRTNEELIALISREILEFNRTGSRIHKTLEKAIKRVERQS